MPLSLFDEKRPLGTASGTLSKGLLPALRLVPEAYRFEGRSRQPAQDGCNTMLNYSYGVLYSLVERACICAGLDPFVGFLHTDKTSCSGTS